MTCGAQVGAGIRPDARKPVTILFNDVTGSTTLGERLEPEAVRQVMSRYFDAVSGACHRHGGTVEKFIGDAVMAVFGLTAVQEDHALRAVRAAAELSQELAALNRELAAKWGVELATRTGLNSGEVVTGDPASGQALVTGDPVNLAARLEQAASPGETLLGDATRSLVAEAIEVEPVEPLVVKGKAEPVRAWRLVEVVSRAGPVARRLDTPMLGRDRELAQLREVLERAVGERSARLVTVLGPAGIGKSRLAEELRVDVGDEARVLVGRCLPYGEGITFWPLAEIVRQIAPEEPRAAIAQLLAGDRHADLIAERVTQAVGLAEGGDAGADLTSAIRSFLEAVARERPAVIVFEDIHWAEAPLLDLIEQLVEWIRDAPLMLLCLAREDLLEKRPGWMDGKPNTSTVALEPLSERDTSALIDDLLAEGTVSESSRAELVERSEGNPLFVEQMLALARERGDGEPSVIPPTIQALLAARLDRLPVEELAVIGAASVVGKEFWAPAVEALVDHRDVEVEDLLATLQQKQLIRPDRATLTGEEGFSFRHVLIRDAAYEALTKQSRSELHERFADWMEASYAERLIEFEAILGYHLEHAYEYRAELAPLDSEASELAQRGATRLASAGRRAARAREDETAVNLLTRASSLLPPAARERLELLPLIGESLEGTASHAKAGEIYAEALDGALASGNAAVEGLARLGRAHIWFVVEPEASAEQILAEAERAIEILGRVGDDRGLAEAWRLVGETRLYDGHAASGQRALEQALEYLGPDVSPRSWNAILFTMGMCLLDGPEPLDRAVAFAEERLEMARARGLRSLEADMLHALGVGEARRERFASGRDALTSSTAISEELGLRYMAEWSRRSLGHLELAAGDPQAAERALRRSYDVMAEMGLNSSLGEAAVPLADALLEQGRHDEATGVLDTIKEDWASGDASIEAPRLAVRAKLLAAGGWDKHAERAAGRALRLVRRTDWACLVTDTLLAQADVLRLAGRRDEAVASAREALTIADGKGYEAAAARARRLLGEPAEAVPEGVR